MQTTRPPKEQVRQFMQQRQTARTPPPTPDEIRRQLGWFLKAGAKTTGR